MRKIILAVAVGFGFGSSCASAADLAPRPVFKAPPPVVAAFSWSGCYVGAQVGYAWLRSPNSFSTTGADPFTPEANTDSNGAIAGGHLGCNYQTGQWVFGLEGDGEWSNLKGNDAGVATDNNELAALWMASVRGRVGYAWEQSLFYVTGGVAFMGARSSILDPTEQESVSKTLTGWTVGAGYEYAFTANWSARIEYRYANFGTNDFAYPVNAYTERANDISVQAVRLGVSYRF